MKKIILISLTLISLSCKSQDVVNSENLTINGVNVLFQNKSIITSNFGTPIEIEKDFAEMDNKDMYLYKYNGIVFYVIEDIVDYFEIIGIDFSFTNYNIKVGDNINLLKSIFPKSFANKKDGYMSLQISNNDMFVSIDYDLITNKITSIGVSSN